MDELASAGSREFPTVVYAWDFSRWKKPVVRQFFEGSRVVFVRRASQVKPGSTLALWGCRPVPDNLPDGVRIIRLEDGFLRSVGLGADLIRPLSWVIDTCGIYYDATRPSDLEILLQTTEFTSGLLIRAASFRERVVSSGLTKYNVGSRSWQRPQSDKRVILVPGQVESDASLAFGAPGIRSNLGLLHAVRQAHPHAWLVYKPHPDVLAGLRAKGKGEDEAAAWCDEQVTDVSMGELLSRVDEVHVLTSLAGFEALLRGRAVTCYGQPFYAGWGLTTDLLAVPRRTRQLSLDELVAGVLLLYPAYVGLGSGRCTTAESALDELVTWRASVGDHVTWWRKLFRVILRRIVGVR
ncbi:capsular polysaccharide export protein, LipB/KpsS family [Sulfuriferula plumbiphila]|nr:beta-3-deoxy-D-manno-oct-2-ulosonic acid transferase [Sulfuriferula plumbiphila]